MYFAAMLKQLNIKAVKNIKINAALYIEYACKEDYSFYTIP